MSYALGASIGNSVKQQGFDSLDVMWIARGIADATMDSLIMTETDIQELMLTARGIAEVRIQNRNNAVGAENKAKGEAFLVENGSRPGVVTTASGLQYEVLAQGSGPNPTAENTVTVHYSGTLIDGTKFDSSYDRGEPIEFPLNRVIPGWTEGVQLMNKGAKFKFYIPAELGYGPNGAGGDIGPNATLIFEVELIDFK